VDLAAWRRQPTPATSTTTNTTPKPATRQSAIKRDHRRWIILQLAFWQSGGASITASKIQTFLRTLPSPETDVSTFATVLWAKNDYAAWVAQDPSADDLAPHQYELTTSPGPVCRSIGQVRRICAVYGIRYRTVRKMTQSATRRERGDVKSRRQYD
jgi:hypothetical protein